MRPSMPRPKLRRSACRRKISAVPTVHSRQSRSRSSREIEPLRVRSFLEWPFFEPEHREIAERLDDWAARHVANRAHVEDRASVDGACRALVRELGLAGWTRYSAPYAAVAHTVSSIPDDKDDSELAKQRDRAVQPVKRVPNRAARSFLRGKAGNGSSFSGSRPSRRRYRIRRPPGSRPTCPNRWPVHRGRPRHHGRPVAAAGSYHRTPRRDRR